MESGDTITFDDIAGLDDAKQTVQEVVCWPMKRPDLFTGLRKAPNGLLLYGPPGTVSISLPHTFSCDLLNWYDPETRTYPIPSYVIMFCAGQIIPSQGGSDRIRCNILFRIFGRSDQQVAG